MLFFYFIIISFSLMGYGLLTSKTLGIKVNNLGVIGILGIVFLSLVSFSLSIFFVHDYIFNLVFLILGLILFVYFFRITLVTKQEIINYFLIFFILFIFILVGKNHDDFAYYHFGYTIFLTEFTHPIGLGRFNNGFRSPSSIFFLNSMFYLPKIGFYSFNLIQALIFGFANLILLEKIFNKNFFENKRFINFLSLIIFIFINIFFYRLGEHGTDRSGMILILICFLYLLILINNDKNEKFNQNNNAFIKTFLIFLCFVTTIKPFYLIYLSLVFILLFYKDTRSKILELITSKIFLFCFIIVGFSTFYTFINSGCLVFPLNITCFYDLEWSLTKKTISNVNSWFELWAKGGAGPGYKAFDNKLEYIANFNWFKNWVNVYFFNKVLDFLLGVAFLSIVVCYLFKNKNKSIKKDINFFPVYIFIILYFIEWFLKHPALRYGGYHIIGILFFLPIAIYLSNLDISRKEFIKKTKILLAVTLIVFLSRNINRLINELDRYDYNPLRNTNYKFIGGDQNFHFRFNRLMRDNIENYNSIEFLNKNIYILTKKK